MQQESLTAAARLPALAELRALLPSVNQPHNHRLLVDAMGHFKTAQLFHNHMDELTLRILDVDPHEVKALMT